MAKRRHLGMTQAGGHRALAQAKDDIAWDAQADSMVVRAHQHGGGLTTKVHTN